MRTRFHGYVHSAKFGPIIMPPKKAKSSKKGNKSSTVKKLKKQQEQEKKEEARRLREEEEARLQAEREEQERQEQYVKELELERLELKDRERRDDELDELRHLLEENHTAVTRWKNDAVEKAQWERYMRCDGSPDPTVVQEVNTYICLWRDDPDVNITSILQKCNHALQLVEELEGLVRDGADSNKLENYQEALINLQELIHFKHKLTAEDILVRANKCIDTETGNMQTVIKDDNVTLCLWANLKKNPRLKALNFDEAGIGFELPKQLAVSSIAVRILHTQYDHLSMLARMAHQKIDTPSHRSITGADQFADDLAEQDEAKADEEVKSIQASERQQSAVSLRSRESSAQHAERQPSQIQTQMEALDAEEELAAALVQPTAAEQTERVRAVDMMQYTPLGGIFYCDTFVLPPQAYHVGDWEIRQILQKGLQVFPYPTEAKLDDDPTLSCPPVGVSVTVPDCVVFLKSPQVARWDAAGTQWRMDGITDVSYEEEEARLSFNMRSFQAFVLMQETYANFPFQSWELRPLCQDSAVFIVNGALINLSITIKGDQCVLQAEQHKGLAHLLGKWMSSPALQKAMIDAGINIFVNEYTEKYISTCCKDPLTEHAAYEQMALLASASAFSWSKWNAKCGAEHLVMQACEHLSPDPVTEESWSLYLVGAQTSKKLHLQETSQSFSPDHHPGSEFHSTFFHMLQDDMSAEGISRARRSNYLFIDTVQSLLCAARPLMHS